MAGKRYLQHRSWMAIVSRPIGQLRFWLRFSPPRRSKTDVVQIAVQRPAVLPDFDCSRFGRRSDDLLPLSNEDEPCSRSVRRAYTRCLQVVTLRTIDNSPRNGSRCCHSLEGVVAKHSDSSILAGRQRPGSMSSRWRTVDCVVTAWLATDAPMLVLGPASRRPWSPSTSALPVPLVQTSEPLAAIF